MCPHNVLRLFPRSAAAKVCVERRSHLDFAVVFPGFHTWIIWEFRFLCKRNDPKYVQIGELDQQKNCIYPGLFAEKRRLLYTDRPVPDNIRMKILKMQTALSWRPAFHRKNIRNPDDLIAAAMPATTRPDLQRRLWRFQNRRIITRCSRRFALSGRFT